MILYLLNTGNLIENEEKLVELLSSFFINTAQNTIGSAPNSLGDSFKPQKIN